MVSGEERGISIITSDREGGTVRYGHATARQHTGAAQGRAADPQGPQGPIAGGRPHQGRQPRPAGLPFYPSETTAGLQGRVNTIIGCKEILEGDPRVEGIKQQIIEEYRDTVFRDTVWPDPPLGTHLGKQKLN